MSLRFTFVARAGPPLVTVTRYERLSPTCPGFGDAVLVIERSTLEGLITLNVAGTVFMIVPAIPVILTLYVPRGVPAPVAAVSVEVFEVASVIFTEAGLKLAVVPAGKPVELRATVPVNPASGVTVTEYAALSPGITARADGLTVIEKFGVLDADAEATKVR